MKKAAVSVGILSCFVLALSQCSLYDLFLRERLGDVRVSFYLRNVPQEFPGNPDGGEYTWAVYVDLDDDPLTGDADGFDALLCAKRNAEFALIDLSGSSVFGESHELSAAGSSLDHDAVCYVDAAQDFIIVSGYSAWAELAGLDAGSRFRCSTTYDTLAGPVSDATPDFYGPGALIDGEGDLVGSDTYPFLDITGITIEY